MIFTPCTGPLSGSFPILSLRTNKADVVVGVEAETAENLDKDGNQWRVNGKCV
jgi:damage-control phosphatase, subfamily III